MALDYSTRRGRRVSRQSLWSIEPRVPDSNLVNVVVETPAGSRNKFKFDEKKRKVRRSEMTA